MNKHEQKKKLVGPWRNLHTAVWLIGLAILAWKNWWWPGILVLVAISALIEGVLMKYAPDAFEIEEEPAAGPDQPLPPSPEPPSPPPAAPSPERHPELLPLTCPKCGAPIRGHEVKWTGTQSADCPFCGTNLPFVRG
jgi:hypothetical protein